MNINQVYVVGRDQHWFSSLRQAIEKSLAVEAVQCSGKSIGQRNNAKSIGESTIVLVDVLFLPDIQETVRYLRDSGWKYVIFVSASPSVKEAYTVLSSAPSYDYWKKTYSISKIRSELEHYLGEVENKHNVNFHCNIPSHSQ